MIDLFLITQLIAQNPEHQKFCATALNIPYATDNITDKEWNDFQACMKFFARRSLDTQ